MVGFSHIRSQRFIQLTTFLGDLPGNIFMATRLFQPSKNFNCDVFCSRRLKLEYNCGYKFIYNYPQLCVLTEYVATRLKIKVSFKYLDLNFIFFTEKYNIPGCFFKMQFSVFHKTPSFGLFLKVYVAK